MPSALLVSQNRQRSQQGGEIHPARGQAGPAGDLDGLKTAQSALNTFEKKYGAKYSGAVECQDRDALLAFYNFPAEHHVRTTNPIESVFATVRHRTVRVKGALSQDTAKLMVFKLITAASRTWRKLKGENQLPKVIQGVKFRDGIEVSVPTSHSAA
jgi:putative transposase